MTQHCTASSPLRRPLLASLVVLSLGLGACQTSGITTGETVGTLAGAAAGGLLGAQFGKGSGQLAMTAAGTLLGGFLGNQAGKVLSENDVQAANANAQRSLEYQPSGSTSTWSNPDTGHSGSITPQPAVSRNGSLCRDYSQEIVVDGRPQQSRGTACRQSDGSWRIAN